MNLVETMKSISLRRILNRSKQLFLFALGLFFLGLWLITTSAHAQDEIVEQRAQSTPIGLPLPGAPVPKLSRRFPEITVRIRDTIAGPRDYHVVVINEQSQKLFAFRRFRPNRAPFRLVIKNFNFGKYRAYTLIRTRAKDGSGDIAYHSLPRYFEFIETPTATATVPVTVPIDLTNTPTATATAENTLLPTVTPTATFSPSPSPSLTPTPTPTSTSTVTPTATATSTATPGIYTLGGSVVGLGAGTLVLQNNGGDNLTLFVDGAFTFSTSVADNAIYNVSVLTQPVAATCSVQNSTGTINSANITNVLVVCLSDS